MNRRQRRAYRGERRAANAAAADSALCWHHLERAHILAQPFPVAHVGSHVAMLRRGASERDIRETVGQAVRILLAAPPSLLNRYPNGNTGRARVPLRATMEIPADLAELLRRRPHRWPLARVRATRLR